MSSKKIPDRWENYTNFGTTVNGTPFLPFKVPLKDELSRSLPRDVAPFRPSDLVEHVTQNNLKVGLIIDLTNTTRYYSSETFEYYGILYAKIYTEGHAVPNSRICKQFFETVDSFLSNASDYNLIGVHCTHGVNRTGYLICRYMIDKLHINPKESLEAFTNARGHCIERENYIKALLDESYQLDIRSDLSILNQPTLQNESQKKDKHKKSYNSNVFNPYKRHQPFRNETYQDLNYRYNYSMDNYDHSSYNGGYYGDAPFDYNNRYNGGRLRNFGYNFRDYNGNYNYNGNHRYGNDPSRYNYNYGYADKYADNNRTSGKSDRFRWTKCIGESSVSGVGLVNKQKIHELKDVQNDKVSSCKLTPLPRNSSDIKVAIETRDLNYTPSSELTSLPRDSSNIEVAIETHDLNYTCETSVEEISSHNLPVVENSNKNTATETHYAYSKVISSNQPILTSDDVSIYE